jgi:hypothetical protein
MFFPFINHVLEFFFPLNNHQNVIQLNKIKKINQTNVCFWKKNILNCVHN